jgi:hypothetical protein
MVDLLERIRTSAKSIFLIRRNRTTTAQRRFERLSGSLHALDGLRNDTASGSVIFCGQLRWWKATSASGTGAGRIRWPGLSRSLDLVVNSAGLTDFNPDLRDAVSSNVESTEHLLNFIRGTDHAALMHSRRAISLACDGRVTETLQDN